MVVAALGHMMPPWGGISVGVSASMSIEEPGIVVGTRCVRVHDERRWLLQIAPRLEYENGGASGGEGGDHVGVSNGEFTSICAM